MSVIYLYVGSLEYSVHKTTIVSRSNANLLLHLPFASLTDYDVEKEFESPKKYINLLMEENNFDAIIKETKFMNTLNGKDTDPCKYFDVDDFISLKLNQRTSLNIFSLNIRSLPKHAGELLCFLESLETQFDVIVLTEIGRCNLSTVENLFKGFTNYFSPPINNSKGGVGIFISNRLGKKMRKTNIEIVRTCGCAICEIESVCLTFDCYDLSFCLLGVYRHPSGNKKHFITDLEKSLEKINKKHITYLIGDLNIDLMLFDKITDHGDYATMLFSHGFLPYITFPTRITPHSATLIDHIFIKTNNIELETVAGILYSEISDHLPCFITVKTNTSIINPDRPKVRLFGPNQCNIFIEKMTNFDWDVIYTENTDWYQEFVSVVYNIFASSFPMVTISRKRIKDKIWITKGLKISCRTNSKLYKHSLKHPNSPAAQKYPRYNKILKSCISKAEISYHADIFQNKETSSKDIWKHLNSTINCGKTRRKTDIDKIFFKEKFHTTDEDIANAMNEHFCTVGETLQSRLPNTDSDSFKKYLPPSTLNSFVLSHIMHEEIIREIKNLNSKKAIGPDGIGAKIIKLCPPIFADNLMKIFNRSIDLGEYPSDMKIARVIALFKKGNHSEPENYRPISLLSCFNKLFEKLICIQLKDFIEKYKIYVEFQFGFRAGHSTILALTEITDRIRSLMENGNYVFGLFVDLSKAFDTVNHDILLYKLSHYGIRGHANKFFRSYLSGRKQFTNINNVKSTSRSISCGVPQGSVLGPVLFLLYINDLSRAVGDNISRLFADDTGVFTHGRNINVLRNDSVTKYRLLFKWCLENRLTINYSKTCFIVFHPINKPMPADLKDIKVDNITISRVEVTKYLGLHLDEKLNWKHHVTQLCQGLTKFFGIFKKIRESLTSKLAKQLYYAFIYSRIHYGIQIYGSCAATTLSKIQRLSNGLLKFLLRYDRRTSTTTLHKDLKILKVDDIYEVNILTFVGNCLNGKCPKIFENYYNYQHQQHSLRDSRPKLTVPRHRTEYAFDSVRIKGAVLWNSLSTEIKSKATLKSFRKILKSHYIGRY